MSFNKTRNQEDVLEQFKRLNEEEQYLCEEMVADRLAGNSPTDRVTNEQVEVLETAAERNETIRHLMYNDTSLSDEREESIRKQQLENEDVNRQRIREVANRAYDAIMDEAQPIMERKAQEQMFDNSVS